MKLFFWGCNIKLKGLIVIKLRLFDFFKYWELIL